MSESVQKDQVPHPEGSAWTGTKMSSPKTSLLWLLQSCSNVICRLPNKIKTNRYKPVVRPLHPFLFALKEGKAESTTWGVFGVCALWRWRGSCVGKNDSCKTVNFGDEESPSLEGHDSSRVTWAEVVSGKMTREWEVTSHSFEIIQIRALTHLLVQLFNLSIRLVWAKGFTIVHQGFWFLTLFQKKYKRNYLITLLHATRIEGSSD